MAIDVVDSLAFLALSCFSKFHDYDCILKFLFAF